MTNFKKWIVPFAACALFFFSDTAWAGVDLNLHRTWVRYADAYRATALTQTEVDALKKTAAKNPADSVKLGCLYYVQKQYEDAATAVLRAADKGNPDALLLGSAWYLTRSGSKEKTRGVNIMKREARNGNPIAQYLLGAMYEEGYGVPADAKESKNWYARASEQGMNAAALTDDRKFGAVLTAWRGAAADSKRQKTEVPPAPEPTPAPQPAPEGGSKTPSAALPDAQQPVMDKVTYKKGAKMPDPDGVSLVMLQNAWDRLRKVTGISAWLVYDDQDVLNAYITKNDKGEFVVVVYRGLMKIFRAEDEIAGVLGHESSHGLRSHLEKGRNNQIGISVAASILSSLLGNSIADIAVGAGAELAKNGYSREAEVEADDYGTEFCAKAGYSPWGLYNAVKRMAEAGAVTPPSGFNSHPPTERRMKRLNDKAEYWNKQLGAGNVKK